MRAMSIKLSEFECANLAGFKNSPRLKRGAQKILKIISAVYGCRLRKLKKQSAKPENARAKVKVLRSIKNVSPFSPPTAR